MSDLPPERHYDDREVSRLLRRASELQRASGTTPATGLTLRELEEVAAEAGIDPGALRQAATELGARDERGGAGRFFAGAPPRIQLERTLPFEATANGLDSLLPIIEIAAEAPGSGRRAGNTLTWSSDNNQTPRRMRVVVTVRAGSTAVRVEDSYGLVAGVSYSIAVPTVGGAAFGIGAALASVLGLPVLLPATPLVAASLAAALVRSILPGRIRRRRRLLERLLEDICQSLAGSASERQLNA